VLLNDTTDDSKAVATEHGAVLFESDGADTATRRTSRCRRRPSPGRSRLTRMKKCPWRSRRRSRRSSSEKTSIASRARGFRAKVWFIDRWILHGDWYPDRCVRLFHRSRARWGGDEFVHEKVEAGGPVATLSGDLHHYSFPSLSSHVAKFNTFADLFVAQQKARGGRFSFFTAVFRPAGGSFGPT